MQPSVSASAVATPPSGSRTSQPIDPRPISTLLRAAEEAHSFPYDQLCFDPTPLAEGSFGKVYRVLHETSGSIFAAKVLKVTEGELDEEAKEDFKREAALLYSLRHSNVVGFVGITRDLEGTLMLLSEFMTGGALCAWLYKRRHKFGGEASIRLSIDIASGLAYLHSRGIVHRDLKSDNILLDERGAHAKIADLGLAKIRSASSYYMHGQMGTVMYMAPEMLRKEKFTSAADVYSFSLVLFELYTARRPYPLRMASDIDALRAAIAVNGERPVDRDNLIPHVVGQVLRRCWANDYHSRPPVTAVLEELRSIAAPATIVSAPQDNARLSSSAGTARPPT